MKKYIRIDGENLDFPIIICNTDDIAIHDLCEREFIEELCRPHLEECAYREIDNDVVFCVPIESRFCCDEEMAHAQVALTRLKKWPHNILGKGSASEKQTIGSFNYLWNIMERLGDLT